MKKLILGLSTMLVMLASTSCGDGKSMVTPISSGRPYEVLVVADDQVLDEPGQCAFSCIGYRCARTSPVGALFPYISCKT